MKLAHTCKHNDNRSSDGQSPRGCSGRRVLGTQGTDDAPLVPEEGVLFLAPHHCAWAEGVIPDPVGSRKQRLTVPGADQGRPPGGGESPWIWKDEQEVTVGEGEGHSRLRDEAQGSKA